jgi:Flp pilus assembly protein TadD
LNVQKLIPLLIAALLVYFGFQVHWLLGLVVIVALIGYASWSNRANLLASKAQEAGARGDTKTAVKLLEQAVRMNRKQPAIMASYAYMLLKDGQIDKADETIGTVRQMPGADKLELNVTITEALIRWKQGRLNDAIAMLEELHGKMQNTMLYGSLGYLYLEQGDLDKALAFNLEAYDYNDSDNVILDNLLATRILRGEWEEARELADALMDRNAKFPEAFYHAALVKEHFGYLESALEHCEWALERRFTAVSTEKRETIEAKRDELAARLAREAESGERDENGETAEEGVGQHDNAQADDGQTGGRPE